MNAQPASIKQNKQTTSFQATHDQRAHEQSHVAINRQFRVESSLTPPPLFKVPFRSHMWPLPT